LERALDVRNDLTRIEIVVSVDRLIVGVGAVIRIVTVRRVPVVVIPVVISSAEERDPAVVAAPPMTVVVPPVVMAARQFKGEDARGVVTVLPVPVLVGSVLPVAISHAGVCLHGSVRTFRRH